jgi:hypothetical protein
MHILWGYSAKPLLLVVKIFIIMRAIKHPADSPGSATVTAYGTQKPGKGCVKPTHFSGFRIIAAIP